ncbi:MAG: CoA transferase [Candidatus Binatia bacterium]|nr:CoA transferase [Candidatus Binatia bacterium]
MRLLADVRVVDLAGEPAAMTGRILADLGAEVVRIEPPDGDPLRIVGPLLGTHGEGGRSLRFAAWSAGKKSVVASADSAELRALLLGADVVLETPGWPGAFTLDPSSAPQAVWVRVTAFGATGPRAGWRGSDLGVMAASGNMFSTGDPDRAPVRSTEPSAYAHVGPEAAFAVLSGLASGRPQVIDLSMQEVVAVANMSGVVQASRGGPAGRRMGAQMGRTREIWHTKDGFVSFGLRGGRARVASLQTLTSMLVEEGLATPAWTDRDWETFDQVKATDEELAALQAPLTSLFASKTMIELYQKACDTNLMLAPVNSPHEILASVQAKSRGMYREFDGLKGFPMRFAAVESVDGSVSSIDAAHGAPAPGANAPAAWRPRRSAGTPAGKGGAWDGVKIVEFGAGAAGPIAARYFAEHGATVIKVESKTRPEFLRAMWASSSPHGLDGSPLFDALNAGKRSVTLNLKNEDGVDVARRLIHWADAVLENFAPRAMRGFGLDYETLAKDAPDLVMVSTCLNGQTGPHRNYPGFGGQGSALSGYNAVTGWPDREPMGPYGTITDSLAPRFAATALAAGLLHRRRTGRGVHFDIAQVEAAQYTLAPWILDYANNGRVGPRTGNRSDRAAPHGSFPCLGDDRWVAIAIWTDDEWERLARHIGIDEPSLARAEARLARVADVEDRIAAWTASKTREQVTEVLQADGIEAVPVQDFVDVGVDPQLVARDHFEKLDHACFGESPYERNGFRLSDAPSAYGRPSPLLGEHTYEVLREMLGLSEAEISRRRESGGVE